MPPSPERFRALGLGGTRLYWLDGGGFRLEIREARDESNRAHGVYAGGSIGRLAAAGLVTGVALDDFPLDTIRAKREWLGRAASAAWASELRPV